MDHYVFNIAAAAQGYSQLCGGLAGFSFAVLVWLVERLNTKDENTREDVLVIRALVYLGVTFLGNLVVSFFWALIAGEGEPGANRTQCLSYIAAWLMAMLGPLTMQAMTQVIATADSRYATKLFRRIFAVTGIIGAAFLWTETRGVLMVYYHDAPPVTVLLEAAQITSWLFLLAGFLLSRRPFTRRFQLDTEGSFANYTSVFLVSILACALAFANLSLSPLTVRLLTPTLAVANLLWAASVAWSCAFLPKE